MLLGIAGLGWWGQRLVRSVQGKSDAVRFVAAAVSDPAKRADVAKELDLELIDSFETLVRDSRIDGVVIATPHSLHPKQVELAAAAGKQVFCEKPLALTAADAQRAIAACSKHGVTLAVGHNRRFAPNVRSLIETVRSGELGKLLHIEGHWSNENTTRPDFGAWRASPLESPGAGMTGTGIHALDIMTALFGKAAVVRVQYRAHSSAGQAARDALSVLMEFGGGVSGVLTTIRPTPRFWRVHVFGLEGSVEARGDTELRLYRRDQAPVVTRFHEIDTLRSELEAFAHSCGGSAHYPVTAEQMIHCAGALEGIVEQLRTREIQHG
ncbi:Gfo/Idh/MocA family oxidoreductase [Variovorax sp. LjRoot130]|uniref:Gfo/Idh/MocA family protein n=1 Tax=Variovorax sp. LjRoot130 TaxID=3342261 RepID=UPI003ED14410